MKIYKSAAHIIYGVRRLLILFYIYVALIISFLAQIFELLHILAVQRKNIRIRYRMGIINEVSGTYLRVRK